MFYPPFNANKTKHFSFKSGCVVHEENGEMSRQLKTKMAKVRLHYLFI